MGILIADGGVGDSIILLGPNGIKGEGTNKENSRAETSTRPLRIRLGSPLQHCAFVANTCFWPNWTKVIFSINLSSLYIHQERWHGVYINFVNCVQIIIFIMY